MRSPDMIIYIFGTETYKTSEKEIQHGKNTSDALRSHRQRQTR